MSISKKDCIGIICGSGWYPRLVAESCIKQDFKCCLLFINGVSSYNEFISLNTTEKHLDTNCKYPNFTSINIGNIESAINFLHENDVTKIILAGAIKRPNFNKLSLDKKGREWLIKLGKSIFRGDDDLLKALAQLITNEGFEVIAGTDIIDGIFIGKGVFTFKHPTKSDIDDIIKGSETAKLLGKLDIGQAVIVHKGLILGVECVEGTDALIERCAKLRKSDSGGILVKVSKPQQDNRLDLPTVGLTTIQKLHTYKFDGLAIEADKCIVISKDLVINQLNEFSMFLYGMK